METATTICLGIIFVSFLFGILSNCKVLITFFISVCALTTIVLIILLIIGIWTGSIPPVSRFWFPS